MISISVDDDYGISATTIETLSKIGFWFKIKAQLAFQPAEILLYFEELKQEFNADIEPKDIFERVSSFRADVSTHENGARPF